MQKDSVVRFVRHIEQQIPDFSETHLSDSFYYASLSFCVMEAVFSSNALHRAAVNVVTRWCEKTQWNIHRDRKDGMNEKPNELKTISHFLDEVGKLASEERIQANEAGHMLASKVFRNMRPTSGRNGVLRAELVLQFCWKLKAAGIESFFDLSDINKLKSASDEISRLPGMGNGNTFDYFLMLAGDDDTVFPSVRLRKFVTEAGYPELNDAALSSLLIAASRELSKKGQVITPRKLGHAIWRKMTRG